jgi:ribonuclease HII
MNDQPQPNPPPPKVLRRDKTAAMTYEQTHLKAGHRCIIGMDEAGYGAWAGPVAAAAVCLPLQDAAAIEKLHGVKDSKQMTPRQRTAAFDVIQSVALGYGIGYAAPQEINRQGLSAALVLAFARAYAACAAMLGETNVDVLMIDGKSVWKNCPHEGSVLVERLPNGDDQSLSIAAASVLAKVWRDEQMIALGALHPAYGFERHKGYGTRAHSEAMKAHGVLAEVHRMAYRPVAALLG